MVILPEGSGRRFVRSTEVRWLGFQVQCSLKDFIYQLVHQDPCQ